MKLTCILTVTLSVLLTACLKPGHDFSYYPQPPVPDYSKTANWAALPDMKDSADALPPGENLADGQAEANADVFYIHPTVNFSRKNWNGDVNDAKLNHTVDIYPLRFQASVFNGMCKVYAPRYRQATLYSFIDKSKVNGAKALDLAYTDVVSAFQYYLDHYNQGRPFIIASHSQGSRHAYRLLRDYFETNPQLRKQLICAYTVGFTTDTVYQFIQPCDSSTQTGCILSWNTYKWGTKSEKGILGENCFCANPLSWKCDTAFAGRDKSLGGIPRKYDRLDKGVVAAKVNNGILWIQKPNKKGYFHVGNNYHVSDYNLFYMNIRTNVKDSVEAYYRLRKD